jgi:diphthine-ammonia ligase
MSAVAYLPRDTDPQCAVLAGLAWELLNEKDKGEEDEDGEERDLWEEKHFAGMENRGAGDVRRELPDWEVVRGEEEVPPFWAVEVEELPRGAAVEWHAHLGVVGGPVEVSI